MDKLLLDLIDEIADLPQNWHAAGCVSRKVLYAIAIHVDKIGTIRHSVETGSGKTTLLFSHLSADHLVFSKDVGESLSAVKKSHLFKSDHVTFIEGPNQVTLPRYTFTHKVQIALIDGPHGYPYPDLEYYYLYPLIEKGGLILLDDIQIPSITRMYEVIRADDMFNLLEVVDNMAFFCRSGAPLMDPLSDNWWLQGYNRAHYEEISGSSLVSSTPWRLMNSVAKKVPGPLKRVVPERVKKFLKKRSRFR